MNDGLFVIVVVLGVLGIAFVVGMYLGHAIDHHQTLNKQIQDLETRALLKRLNR